MVNELRDERGQADDDRLEQRAKGLFDASVERIDARTRSKLTRARHAASDEIKKGAAQWRWLRAPTGGLAAAVLVAVLIVAWRAGREAPADSALPLDDLELVADSDMLQDVEFYAWLDE